MKKLADGGPVEDKERPRNLRYGWQRSTDKDTGVVYEKPNWGRADERKRGGAVCGGSASGAGRLAQAAKYGKKSK